MFGGPKYKRNRIKRVLMNGKFESIQLANRCVSLIALPNAHLVYGILGKVFELNENFKFKEIKIVLTDGYSCCALNQRNEIYVSICQYVYYKYYMCQYVYYFIRFIFE